MQETKRMSQSERTDLSDARMLESAVQLMVSVGPEKTTLKEVGENAGYSRGLAGYRFGSKDGLFEFVIRSISEHWLRELKMAVQDRVGLDAIGAATDLHFRFCQAAPDNVRAFYILWFQDIGASTKTQNVIAGIHDRRHRDIVTWLRKDETLSISGEHIDAIADLFCAAIVGIVYQWLMDPDLMKIKRLHEELKSTIKLLLDQYQFSNEIAGELYG